MSLRRATRLAVTLLLSSAISGIPSTESSIIVGSAITSVNASIAQRELKPGGTILNGDSLRVDDGTALVGLEDGSRITLGKDTIVLF